MPYNEVARTLRAIASILDEEVPKEEPFHYRPYKKRRRQKPKEAPAKEHEYAAHASEEEHRTAEEIQWRKDHSLQRGIAVLTSLAVGFTGVTLFLTLRQVSDSHQTVTQTTRQAKAAEDQRALAKSQEIEQLRSYVGIEPIGVDNFREDGTPTANLIATNYGQTPAFNEDTRIHTYALDYVADTR